MRELGASLYEQEDERARLTLRNAIHSAEASATARV